MNIEVFLESTQTINKSEIDFDVMFELRVGKAFPNSVIFGEKENFQYKRSIRFKANQLINELIQVVNNVGLNDQRIQNLGITQRHIRLYYYSDQGEKWSFENTQSIADIVQKGHWKLESILMNNSSASTFG